MSEGYGARLAQTRRLLSVVLQKDVTQQVAGDMIGAALGSWSRWGNEEMRPRRKWLEAIEVICARVGLPGVTAAWIDYNSGEGPPSIGTVPAVQHRDARPRKAGKPQAQSSAKKSQRRAGGK